jgi:FlaG/FlaF family flagellin (archaellin)
MPLPFLDNRPYAPVDAFYLDVLAGNGGDARQVVFFNVVQDHVAVANHLRGVVMSVVFGSSDDTPAVIPPRS